MTPAPPESQGFSIVPRWIWEGHRPREIQIYAALASHVDWNTGICWPSRQTIADATSCSLDTVDRALRALEATGAISVRRRKREAGHNDTNVYQLPYAIARRAVDNPAGGGRKNAAPQPQNRGLGGRKNAAQTRSSEQEGLTSPKTDPEACGHLPVDDEGYCTACGTDVLDLAVSGSGKDDT